MGRGAARFCICVEVCVVLVRVACKMRESHQRVRNGRFMRGLGASGVLATPGIDDQYYILWDCSPTLEEGPGKILHLYGTLRG